MNVPLIMEPIVMDGIQYVVIWTNGKKHIVKAPILPFAYTKSNPPIESKNELVKRRLLYDIDNEIELYKCSFRTSYELRNCCNETDFYESRINFRERLYFECPDFVKQYANTNELKILSMDCEMSTELRFPNAKEDAIIAVGLQINNMPIEIYMSEKHDDDKELLLTVINRIKELDPDVFVTYNGIRFDFPYFIDRCKINGIPSSLLTRDGTEIEHVLDSKTNQIKETRIGGRLHYDILIRSVKNGQTIKDQNLFSDAPKHFDLKSIAKIYKCPNVIKESQETMSMMCNIVNTQQLYDYLESDIRATTHLRNIYLPALIQHAEDLIVPLHAVVNMVPSYTGTIIFGRKFGSMGIVGDKTVGEAHPELSSVKQGGWVQTFRTGLYKYNLRDMDVTSFYPNLFIQLNLCPTTTRILRTEPELKPYSTSMTDDNHLQLSIPDERANCQIIIDINMNKRGIAADFVNETMAERANIKKLMKEMHKDSAEYADADVNQLSRKITVNAMTGFMGMKYSLFGSLASYIAITGSARHILKSLVEYLNKDGNNCIAANTDGVYLTGGPSLEETHTWLEQFVKDLYYADKSYIWLEDTPYAAGYFQPNAEKHYILLTMPDKEGRQKMIIHGGGLKGSGKIQLYSDVIDEIGLKLLKDVVNKKDVDKYYEVNNWTLDKLTFGRNVKQKSTYKNVGDLGIQLIDQYEKRFNVELKEPTRLSYVKIKSIKTKYKKRMTVEDALKNASEYRLVTIFDKLDDIKNLDLQYYTEEVDKALERLGLERLCPKNRTKQKALFDF